MTRLQKLEDAMSILKDVWKSSPTDEYAKDMVLIAMEKLELAIAQIESYSTTIPDPNLERDWSQFLKAGVT